MARESQDKPTRFTQFESIDSRSPGERAHLLLVLLLAVLDDVVEAELVDTLGGGDNADPVTELLLLEVLLGPVERNGQPEIQEFKY